MNGNEESKNIYNIRSLLVTLSQLIEDSVNITAYCTPQINIRIAAQQAIQF